MQTSIHLPQNKKTKQNKKSKNNERGSISPVLGGLCQLVLRLLVLRLHPQHEASTSQLGFRLLQLVSQVKDLTCRVVSVLQKTHTQKKVKETQLEFSRQRSGLHL